MALERVPADIRAQGGVARMSDPAMIKEIMSAVTIPVMAKARIGHFVECQVRFLHVHLKMLDLPLTILSLSSRFLKPLASTISTSRKFSPRPMIAITSPSQHFGFPSSAAAAIWERHYAGFRKGRP